MSKAHNRKTDEKIESEKDAQSNSVHREYSKNSKVKSAAKYNDQIRRGRDIGTTKSSETYYEDKSKHKKLKQKEIVHFGKIAESLEQHELITI